MQSRAYQKKLETGEVLEKVAFEVSVSKLECGSQSVAEEPAVVAAASENAE
jgi:hypothetical protein